MDPLRSLPAEIVLRIIDFACLDSLAQLTRLNQTWHQFIEITHQDVAYAGKLPDVANLLNPEDYFSSLKTFSKYGDGVTSWKEACRRHTLLVRNWDAEQPVTRESIIHMKPPSHFVWRFKPDFKRRLVISTSQTGGVYVTDMDTGALLWSMQDEGDVRGYAHLEYQDGTAVWDRFGSTLEVWKTDLPDLPRGHFRNIGLLHHEAETRGFQLSFDTLCVVATDGHGFVYDLQPGEAPPTLRTQLEIPEGAVGHLDQGEHVAMYSMGVQGYHFYDKTSGSALGQIRPHAVDPFKVYHVDHPAAPPSDYDLIRREIMGLIPSNDHHHAPFPPQNPQTDRLVSCRILRGPLRSNHPVPIAVHTPAMADDDWGAAMLNGKTMVGVSRGGRIMVCTDWERALRSEDDFAAVTSLIECEPSTGADFDLGGWLSIHKTPAGKRILLEIKNRIYILRLDPQDLLDIKLPILVATTSSPSLGVPVSFMGVYDDCIMSTFTMVRPHMDIPDEDDVNEEGYPNLRVVPTKLIRVLTVAPEL